MKKALALLVALLVTATLFAACTNQPDNSPAAAETTAAVAEVQTTLENTQAPEVQQPTEVKEEETLPAPSEAVEQTANKNNEHKKPENQVKKTEKQASADVKVTKEEVKKTVLAHAKLNEADVKFYKVELDRERNGLVYEVEFDSGKYEYDYEVDAENGKVLKAEKEFRD